MGINTRPPRRRGDTTTSINMHGTTEATTYKPTYAKTRHRISTSGISTVRPLRCLRILSGETKALSLISPGTDSRRKATLLSTTSQIIRPPGRQQLDRLPQILYWCDYHEQEQYRLWPTGCRVITWQFRGPNLYKNHRLCLFYLSLTYILVPTIPILCKYRNRDIKRRQCC